MRDITSRLLMAGLLAASLLSGTRVASADDLYLSDYQPVADGVAAGNCGGPACSACGAAGCLDYCLMPCSESVWVTSDYLLWWMKGNRLPALVTTSPVGTPRDEAGVLGFADTDVLFGDERVDANLRHGVRYRAGMWLDAYDSTGIEAHYLYLNDGNNTGDYFAQSNGTPILARPFFNTKLGAEDSQLIAYPNVVEGQITIQTSSELHSTGILLRKAGWREGNLSIDLLGGYRFLRYREGISMLENLVVTDVTGFPSGTELDVRDTFIAQNDFHGGEIGLQSTYYHNGLMLDLIAKVALGNVHQDVQVRGSRQTTFPNMQPVVSDEGFLALPTNIGQRTRNRFAFLPELNANIRYPLTDCLRLNVGYSLLYLTRAVRSGDQIDRVINPDQFPQNGGLMTDPERPAPLIRDTAIWAQGINVGIEWFY